MVRAPDLGSDGLEWTAPPAGSAPDLTATPDSSRASGAEPRAGTRGVGLASSTLPPSPPPKAETPRFWDGLVRFRNKGKAWKG